LENTKGKYHLEDIEIDCMIISKTFLIVIGWTELKLIGLMVGICANGNEILSFVKKIKETSR
jgi:hypothetical protein